MTEKRLYGRFPFEMAIHLEPSAGSTGGTLEDISLKGALVRFSSPPTLKPGERIRLTLDLSPDVRLVFEAEAVHFHAESIGVRFVEMDDETMGHLLRLLELNSGNAEQVERELHFLVGKG